MLSIKLTFFVFHGVVRATASERLTKLITLLLVGKAVLFAHLMKLELVLHCLADHILQLVSIPQIDSASTGRVPTSDSSICRIDDDWHDHRLLLLLALHHTSFHNLLLRGLLPRLL